ncbi:MAG: ATP-binding protein [Lentisphaerota bacterium]
MKRIYESLLTSHFRENRQMAFLSGPRQVGKTTCAWSLHPERVYINWDVAADRRLIMEGCDAVAAKAGLHGLQAGLPTVVFDELHKYPKWKSFLKGLFDVYQDRGHFLVTGSAHLNVYKRGGDSLMGRYFPYRMHPLSVAELNPSKERIKELGMPRRTDEAHWRSLVRWGGFPEPFLKDAERFYNRWSEQRTEQLFREDLRDLTRLHETGQIQMLAELLAAQTGCLLNYSQLAKQLQVAVDTIRRWVCVLENFYFCFTVRPWFKNVAKSLRKMPKVYLWDWSMAPQAGARYENFVASHLLKAIHWWSDCGLGRYGLYYLRDKAQREVDFLVVRNDRPWFLVESKSSSKRDLNPQLSYYQRQIGAEHAFQMVEDLEFVDKDCFEQRQPIIVPARTLLSQLI